MFQFGKRRSSGISDCFGCAESVCFLVCILSHNDLKCFSWIYSHSIDSIHVYVFIHTFIERQNEFLRQLTFVFLFSSLYMCLPHTSRKRINEFWYNVRCSLWHIPIAMWRCSLCPKYSMNHQRLSESVPSMKLLFINQRAFIINIYKIEREWILSEMQSINTRQKQLCETSVVNPNSRESAITTTKSRNKKK